MDTIRVLAGIFFVVWSIVGIVMLIGSILLIGFIATASSALSNSPLMMLAGGELGGSGYGGKSTALPQGASEAAPMKEGGKYQPPPLTDPAIQAQIACATKLVGKERAMEIYYNYNPTPEESKLLEQCGN